MERPIQVRNSTWAGRRRVPSIASMNARGESYLLIASRGTRASSVCGKSPGPRGAGQLELTHATLRVWTAPNAVIEVEKKGRSLLQLPTHGKQGLRSLVCAAGCMNTYLYDKYTGAFQWWTRICGTPHNNPALQAPRCRFPAKKDSQASC